MFDVNAYFMCTFKKTKYHISAGVDLSLLKGHIKLRLNKPNSIIKHDRVQTFSKYTYCMSLLFIPLTRAIYHYLLNTTMRVPT